MGGSFAGGLAIGLANALQKGQEQAIQDQYKKTLIEQSKLQTKQLENKLNLAQYEQQMLGTIAKEAGFNLPSMPQPSPVQQVQAPQKTGLLGRIFGGQQPTPPQPAPQAQQAPITQQIAEGQMQGQIDPAKQALAKDILFKKYFDIDTKYREQGNVARSGTIMTPQGPQFTLFDRTGKPIQGYQAPAEPYRQKVVTSQGTFEVEQPKYGTGGISQVAPAEMERTKIKTNFGDFEVLKPKYGQPGETTQTAPAGEGITAEKAGKINLIGNAMDRVPEIQGLIYPNGQLDRGILAKGKNPLGVPIGSGAILYSKMYQAMDSALRMETGAQANPSEIDTKVKEYWPNAYDTEEAIKSKLSDFESYIKGAANSIDPTGELRKIRQSGNVPSGTKQGRPSLNLQNNQKITTQQIESEYQQALKMRPDLAPQLKAKRDQLIQQVR